MSEIESPPVKHHFDLFEYIKDIQSRNGIREDQHIRYRQYCSRRLRRVRVVNKIPVRGGSRYKKTPLTLSQYTTPQHLTIPLLNAERAWAFAMELQGSLETLEENIELRRARHKIKRRLLRAAEHARELEEVCGHVADAYTQLQATAYLFWLQGVYHLEVEQWHDALVTFTSAKEGLLKLQAIAESDHNSTLIQICKDRISQLQLYITFSSNRLNRLNPGAAAEAVASSHDNVLMAKLSALAAHTSKGSGGNADVAKQLRQVSFFGATYPVSNPRTWAKLHEAQVFYASYSARLASQQQSQSTMPAGDGMDDAVATQGSSTQDDDLANVVDDDERFFARLQGFYDAALIFINQDLKSLETSKARVKTRSDDEAIAYLSGLAQYTRCRKTEATIQRHILALAQALKKHQQNLSASSAASTQEQTNSLRVIVTMIDRLLYSLQQASTVFADTPLLPVVEQKKMIADALRTYYVALVYSTQNKPLEAYRLAEFAQQQFHKILSTTFITTPVASPSSSDDALNSIFHLLVITPSEAQLIHDRSDNMKYLMPYLQALCVAQTISEETQLSASVDKISLDDADSSATGRPLIAQLFDEDIVVPANFSLQQPLAHGAFHRMRNIMALPPQPVLLPAKPFVFDMAYTNILAENDILSTTTKPQVKQQPQQQPTSKPKPHQPKQNQQQHQQQQQQQQQQQEPEAPQEEQGKSFWNYLFW